MQKHTLSSRHVSHPQYESSPFGKNFIDQACGEEIHRHALHARVIFSARRVNIRHFVYLMFNFCNRKIALFADENIALFHLKRKKKPNLSELTEVFCGLLSLLFKYF